MRGYCVVLAFLLAPFYLLMLVAVILWRDRHSQIVAALLCAVCYIAWESSLAFAAFLLFAMLAGRSVEKRHV